MESLPNEIIEQILVDPNLSIIDIVNFSSTCSKFKEIVNSNDTVWKAKYFQCWSTTDIEITSNDWHKETITRKNFEKQIRKVLSEMSSKFYHLDMKNINGLHLKFVVPLLTSHKFGYYYMRDFLVYINSLPPTQMLTNKYYGTILLKFINKRHFPQVWSDLLKLKQEEQTLEKGAILISLWQQENKTGIEKFVMSELDSLANLVKQELIQHVKDHPLKDVSENTQSLWKRENIEENMFDPENCKSILWEMNVVFFHVLKFQLSYNLNDFKRTKCGIDNALIDRKAPLFIFAIIYESVARRLGVKIEILDFWNHCLLRWKESYSQMPSSSHYIDVSGEGLFTKSMCSMRHSRDTVTKPCNMQQVAQKATIYIYSYEQLEHNPFVKEILELFLIFKPFNLEFYQHLCRLYMQEDMDSQELILKLLSVRDQMRQEDWRWFQPLFHSLEIYQETWEQNHDRNPKIVVQNRVREIEFAVGMIVRDKLSSQTGIIFGWDIKMAPHKNGQVFYKLLVKDGNSEYVPEENLQILHTPPFISHPSSGRFFDEYCMSYYKPNKQLQAEYPDDMEALLRILKNDRETQKVWIEDQKAESPVNLLVSDSNTDYVV